MVQAECVPTDEDARIAAVHRYKILDTPPDGVFDRIAAMAARAFDVPIAIVSVVDTDRIWFKAHHGLDVTEIDREPGLCASAILGNGPWILTDAKTDPRSLANPLVAGEFGLRFYAGAPLTTQDGFNLGTLCVIDYEPRDVTTGQTQLLTDLAQIVIDELELRNAARLAVDEAQGRLHEVEHLAEALQASLLPPSLPDIPGLEMAALYEPLSRYDVGGDFYDIFPIDDESWGLVIGDVCGKGPVAAGRTSCARFSIRAAAIHQERPSAVMRTVNQSLLADADTADDAPFVTALFASATPHPDHLAIHFACAGHPLPTVLRSDGSIEVVGTAGTLLGSFSSIDVTDSDVRLHAGDTLVLITDGVHDSGRPTPLLQEGLEAILSDCVGAHPSEVVARIRHAVSGRQRDDVAVLVLTAHPASSVPAGQ